VGAAADYVPVNQILHAVNRQEESRLVREWVLRNTPDEGNNHPLAQHARHQPGPTLSELGFTQARALEVLAMRMPNLYEHAEPADLSELAVRQSFVYPTATAHELRRLGSEAWAAAFEDYLSQVRQTFDLAVGTKAANEAWGLAAADGSTGLGFAAGLEGDDRLYPQLLARMHKRLVEHLAASPTGLMRAAEQTQRWLHEAEEGLQKLQTFSTPSTRQLARIQQELAKREWSVQYQELAASEPNFGAILLRAVGATALVGVLSLLYLLVVGRAWNAMQEPWGHCWRELRPIGFIAHGRYGRDGRALRWQKPN
jgi:hypothetical protein